MIVLEGGPTIGDVMDAFSGPDGAGCGPWVMLFALVLFVLMVVVPFLWASHILRF